MRIGSLFSGGLDGLALGLGAALDGTVAFTAERDPWRRAQLERNYPEVPRHYADAAEPAEPVDLLCGGFPCQPHSVAGARRGTSDDRFGWPLFAAAIDRCRPSLVVVENVPGLRTSGLRTVLADLADRGFDAEWRLLSARDVGAPHRRTRLFLVAYSDRHAIRQERGRGEAWSPSSLSLGDGEAGRVAALPDADQERHEGAPAPQPPGRLPAVATAASDGALRRVADADTAREPQQGGPLATLGRRARDCRLQDWGGWAVEPALDRVVDGFPDRVRWLSALGDAVVPWCAYVVGLSLRDWLET